jgi:hypothetical protein
VKGHTALSVWDELPLKTKIHVVKQVAQHLMSIFELRFTHAGSLYLSSNGYNTGPIGSVKFFKSIDGKPLHADPTVHHELHRFRGPFSRVADWLSSPMRAEIFSFSFDLLSPPAVGEYRPRNPSLALKIMNEAVALCSVYPGEHSVHRITDPHKCFSLMFDDFSLSNFMVRF